MVSFTSKTPDKNVNKIIRDVARGRIRTAPPKPTKEQIQNQAMNDIIRDYHSGTNSTRLQGGQFDHLTQEIFPEQKSQHAPGDAGTGTGADNMPNKPQNMSDALREIVELRAILAKARK